MSVAVTKGRAEHRQAHRSIQSSSVSTQRQSHPPASTDTFGPKSRRARIRTRADAHGDVDPETI